VLLIIMGLTACWLFLLGGAFAQEEEAYRHEAMLQATAENICRVVSDVYVAVQNQLPEVEESLDRPDRMMKLVERVVAQNPRIRSCGISFVENYYPGKARCFMPYAVRKDSVTIDVSNLGTEREGYLQEEWFQEGLKAEEGFWSEPFFENNDTITPLVAYIHPIRDKQGRIVAVMGADISLEWLKDKLKEADWEIYYQQWGAGSKKRSAEWIEKMKPHNMLISKKGTFIVHPDEKRIIRDSIGSIVKASKDTVLRVMVQRMMDGMASGEIDFTDEYNYDCWDFEGHSGYVFYMPVKHAGWSLVLFVPEMALDLIAYFIGGVLAFFVLLALVIVWLVSRFSIRRSVKPLKQLASSADEVAKGNFDTPLPDIKHNDEIRLLRDSFEDMQHSLSQYIGDLKTTTASKAAIENELKVAHDIQMSMLPKIFPPYPERGDIDIAGSLSPAKDVGGDLFDFYIREEKLFFCIGDVSGKGVPASLFMAVTRSLFRNVSANDSTPNRIVETLNKAVAENNEQDMFVTLFVGVLNLQTGLLSYCNAGHDAPLLVGQGVGELPCDPNLPIGVVSDQKYSMQEAQVHHLTTIFLYTDGLTEAEDASHSQFGRQRMMEVAEQLLAARKNQPVVLISELTHAVAAFVGNAEQSDDLTMLAIQFK